MNLHNKRSASDDINERRKRRRTISNDLYRGLSVDEIKTKADISDLSSMSSDSDEDEESRTDQSNTSSSSPCSKCKCDEIPKLLKIHNEVFSLLTEMKKDIYDIHKTIRLELQISRQDIIEEVQKMKQDFTRFTDMFNRYTIDRNARNSNSAEHYGQRRERLRGISRGNYREVIISLDDEDMDEDRDEQSNSDEEFYENYLR